MRFDGGNISQIQQRMGGKRLDVIKPHQGMQLRMLDKKSEDVAIPVKLD